MSEYTPTTSEVRTVYAVALFHTEHSHDEHVHDSLVDGDVEFDRWLAQMKAEAVAAERERAAEAVESAREFVLSALAEADADEAEGGSGWDVEVDARTILRLLDSAAIREEDR